METALKRTDTMPVDVEKLLSDDDMILQRDPWIRKKQYEDFVQRQQYEELKNNLMFLKLETLDKEMIQLKDKMSELEQSQHIRERLGYDILFTPEVEQPKNIIEKRLYLDDKSTLNECGAIVERAIEILTEWSETQDIKLQIQYAAVIVGKIENIKKKEFIQENEIRKKICTLLRTVIRLNVTDTVFTKKQLLLLKRGFSLMVADNVIKEDMLQLSRDFRRENLMIIPAWE